MTPLKLDDCTIRSMRIPPSLVDTTQDSAPDPTSGAISLVRNPLPFGLRSSLLHMITKYILWSTDRTETNIRNLRDEGNNSQTEGRDQKVKGNLKSHSCASMWCIKLLTYRNLNGYRSEQCFVINLFILSYYYFWWILIRFNCYLICHVVTILKNEFH